MNVINWSIARHPVNWVIVFLMILIPLVGVDIVSQYHAVNYRPPNAS